MPKFKFLVRVDGVEDLENMIMNLEAESLIDILSKISKYAFKKFNDIKFNEIRKKLKMLTVQHRMAVYEHGFPIESSKEFIPKEYISIKKRNDELNDETYYLFNDNIAIIQLCPTKTYCMIIGERGNLLQMKELIKDSVEGAEYNVIVFKNGHVVKSGFTENLIEFFGGIQGSSNLEMVNEDGTKIRVFIDNQSGMLKNAVTDHEIALQNFMAFNIDIEIEKPKISAEIVESFFSDFKKRGENEKERLISYVRYCHEIRKETGYFIYAPIVNVCQSSGSGKSRLASELMRVMPSAYVVLRQSGESGYPRISQLTKLFFMNWVVGNVSDDFDNKSWPAGSSIAGNYMILIRAILEDYVAELDILSKDNTKEDILNDLRTRMIEDKFYGENLKNLTGSDQTFKKATIAQTISRIQELLKKIKSFYNDPFVLIVDEASLLAEAPENDKKSSKFRLFRRALHGLGSAIDMMIITLGTNSDVLDFNPRISADSFRESFSSFLFPPFIVSRNWDIFLDIDEIVTNKNTIVSYETLHRGRMIIFLLSRGRPMWGSLPLSRIMHTAKVKITNNSLKSGEAYLAFWLVRTGILVNPSHVVTKKLVKSLMATVLHLTPDMKTMRVYYPSEPILAMAARKEVAENPLEYYQRLLDFLRNRAIDSGRIGEIIAMDIFLQAIYKANCDGIDWESTECLPKICERTNFILETDVDNSDVQDALRYSDNIVRSVQPETEDLSFLTSLKEHYKVCTVGEFLKVFRGFSENELKFVPKIMLEGLVNASHFIQFSKTFPTVNFPKTTKFVQPSADSTLPPNAPKCDILTSETCQELMMQQAGGVFPPGYFGADYWIPVCLKDKDENERPIFTAILVQVKKGSVDQAQKVAAKCELSSHFVRCAAHDDCKNQNCTIRLSDSYMKTILGNQLSIVVSLGEPDDPSTSKFPKTKYQIYKKQVKEKEETAEIGSKRKKTETKEMTVDSIASDTKAMDISPSEEKTSNVPGEVPNVSEYFTERFGSIDGYRVPENSEIKYSNLPGPFEATRFVPEAVIENQISKNCSIYGMTSLEGEFERNMTCFILKGLEPYDNILQNEVNPGVNPVIKDILNYDGSVFHDVSNNLDTKELSDAVISRNMPDGIQIVDNLYRELINLAQLPDILPYKYFDGKSHNEKYIDLLEKKIGKP